MEKFKKLTNEELNDFTSRVVVQLEPALTQQIMSLILELTEYRNKIENGTIKEVVRCKDCKRLEELHYEEVDEKPYIKNVCRLFKRTMQLNDFCSYALPKEQQNEQQRKAD